MKPILIQGAMEVELSFLKGSLNIQETTTLGGFPFHHGHFEDYPVILSLTKIGTAYAAAATTLAITQYDPVLILNQGLAGAHATKHHTKDIILGQEAVAINSFEKPMAKEGIHYEYWIETEYFTDKIPLMGDKGLLKIFDEANYIPGNKSKGVLGSGDVWNREWEFIHWLHAQFNSSCEDMESLACYRIARAFGVPILGMRIIANNELNQEVYEPKIADMIQRFLLENMGSVVDYARELQNSQ